MHSLQYFILLLMSVCEYTYTHRSKKSYILKNSLAKKIEII
jgi:hypothetical protein